MSLSRKKQDYPTRHVWEGWTVADFIMELSSSFYTAASFGHFKTRNDVKRWCMDEQPYYKKYIPEVVDHFWEIIK